MSGFLRFLRVSVGLWIGLVVAVPLGIFIGLSVRGPLGNVAGALVLGTLVGIAEKRYVPAKGLAWVAVSAVAVTIGWFLGSAGGFGLFVLGFPRLALYAQAPIAGLVIGGLQASLLRGRGGRRWFVLASVGWSSALTLLLAPALPPLARILGLSIPGIVAVLQGAVPATRPASGRLPQERLAATR
ncbi:MAG: hypothetical protein HOO96_39710 [Polyangiaceae bacterium]|nr:hypothetical protein [Polyangiaceae bacterium]